MILVKNNYNRKTHYGITLCIGILFLLSSTGCRQAKPTNNESDISKYNISQIDSKQSFGGSTTMSSTGNSEALPNNLSSSKKGNSPSPQKIPSDPQNSDTSLIPTISKPAQPLSDDAFLLKMQDEERRNLNIAISYPSFKTTDSLDGQGDYSRIANVLRKAKNGNSVTIGILGDSISAGYLASPLANGYAFLVKNWWENVFGSENVRFVNASIGSNTLTNIVHRMDDDLLSQNPDLVVFGAWKFHNSPDDNNAMESILKRLLDQNIAVIYLQLCATNGDNWDSTMAPIARHYNIPVVSFANAYKKSGLSWSSVAGDNIHPNNAGHSLIALCVNTLFTQIGERLNSIGIVPIALPPSPYQANGWRYVSATIWDRNDAAKFTVKNAGSFSEYLLKMTEFRTYAGWRSASSQGPLVCKLPKISTLHIMFCYFSSGGTASITVTTESGRFICNDMTVNTNGASATGYSWNSPLIGADINEPVTVSIRANNDGDVRVLGFMVTT